MCEPTAAGLRTDDLSHGARESARPRIHFSRCLKAASQYNLNVVGYWVPEDPAWQHTFVYLVAHPSLEEAEANWHALHADPAFLPTAKPRAVD
jgi:hypothetical protein